MNFSEELTITLLTTYDCDLKLMEASDPHNGKKLVVCE